MWTRHGSNMWSDQCKKRQMKTYFIKSCLQWQKKKILSKCHSPWGCQIKAPDLERREAEVVIAAGESNFEDIWDTNNSICRKLYYLLLARTKSWSSLNHVSHHLPIHRCIMFGQYLPSMALAKLSCAVYSPDKIVTAAMIYWHEHDITATQHQPVLGEEIGVRSWQSHSLQNSISSRYLLLPFVFWNKKMFFFFNINSPVIHTLFLQM